jgi:hypothetical protein
MLYQDFPHPMQSCTKDLFPFLYAEFSSFFSNPRAKDTFFPHVRTFPTIQHVYMQVAPLQPAYIEICAKK